MTDHYTPLDWTPGEQNLAYHEERKRRARYDPVHDRHPIITLAGALDAFLCQAPSLVEDQSLRTYAQALRDALENEILGRRLR